MDHESCIHQIIKNQETYLELFFNLGLFKLLNFHNQRSSLLFSFDFQAFPVSGHLLDFNERLLRWKNKSRKLFSFSLSYTSWKFSLFSLSLLCQRCARYCELLTIFQRLVIWREKILMDSLSSYEKLV